MDRPPPAQWLRRRWSSIVRRRPALPSWLLSMLLHVLLVLLLGWALRLAPRSGASAEQTADVGIVLKQRTADQQYYEGPDDQPADAKSGQRAADSTSLAELLSDKPPVDPTSVLPKTRSIVGMAARKDGGVANAGALAGGGGGRAAVGRGGAKVRFFGAEGEGYKFVYVLDRSGSMGGSGRNALEAAKAELARSLQSLDTNHQFQIIFYNEQPRIFNPSGRRGGLSFGSEANKALAVKFAGSITADGSTRHEEALMTAITMRPDVIFFLTDADDPRLSPKQLAKIHRLSGGISINAIEFGFGPQSDAESFLVKLARQNGGQHAYVDISKRILPRGK